MKHPTFFATRTERYAAFALGLTFVVLAVLDIMGVIG